MEDRARKDSLDFVAPVAGGADATGVQETRIADARVAELEMTKRAMLNIMEDLTEEKRLTTAERSKLATIISGIADAIIVVDPQT
ncbi:MAG: hypothetical protein RL272_930, partial [Candidatus Parcubacteria bacterium]